MAEQKLWELRYRKHPDGARSGYVSARDAEAAEAVGRAWCKRESSGLIHGVRFISVAPAVLADEEILKQPDDPRDWSQLTWEERVVAIRGCTIEEARESRRLDEIRIAQGQPKVTTQPPPVTPPTGAAVATAPQKVSLRRY